MQRRPLVLGAGLALGTQVVTGCGAAQQRPAPNLEPTAPAPSPLAPRSAAPAAEAATATTPAPVPALGPEPMPAQARGPDADTLDGVFTDPSRQRAIPWRLRLPAGTQPVAWVIFSHGLGGDLSAGSDWAQAWAQAGIATLHLQHAGSDSALWRQGEAALRQAASGPQLLQRVLDVRAAMDQVQRLAAARGGPATAAWRRLRADALGLAGHSFGAHTTLAVAGQRWGAQGLSLADPRPRAFAAFSPSPAAGQAAAQSFGAITRPVLCLTGSADANPLAPAGTAAASQGGFRRQVYAGLPAGNKAELWLDGADHMSFAGQPTNPLPARLRHRPASAQQQAQRHQALIKAASTGWWRAQLLGDPAAQQALTAGPAGLLPADAWRRA